MENNKKVWFTSDLHFSHKSIMYFHPNRREMCGVGFDDLKNDSENALKKHDEWLIELWNSTVGKHDDIYYLGDFCFGNREKTEKILQKLHGNKYLITGNHDKSLSDLHNYFKWVGSIKEAKFTKDLYPFLDGTFCIEMCHFPMIAWNRRLHGSIMMHGHTHGSINKMNEESGELRLDVGLDGNDYKFLNLEDVYNKMKEVVKNNNPESNTFEEYVSWKSEKDGLRY